MLSFFHDNPTHPTRALQIWQILIGKAHARQTLTYGMLAHLLGFKGAGTLAHPLGHIMFYCRQHNLPPLTVLVVNQTTGVPGDGLLGTNLHAQRELVFRYNWYSIVPPTPETFSAAYALRHKLLGDSAIEPQPLPENDAF
jgi:hypothetical protein